MIEILTSYLKDVFKSIKILENFLKLAELLELILDIMEILFEKT